jgi:DNA-directed RNA polymerase specialized sigma24 family protein
VRLESVAVEVAVRPEAGFDAVYAAHYPSLVRLAYLTTGNLPAAEDVVQDVFIEWYRRRDQVHHPVAYLRRAVASPGRAGARWSCGTRPATPSR